MTNGVNNQTSVLTGTAIAAGVGGVVGASGAFCMQKTMLKNPYPHLVRLTKEVEKSQLIARNTSDAYVKGFHKALATSNLEQIERLIAGKINKQFIAITAAVGAIGLGGIYLAYRGIKALFNRGDK